MLILGLIALVVVALVIFAFKSRSADMSVHIGGRGPQTRIISSVVSGSPPQKTGNPSISGTAQAGLTLTATHGTYTGAINGYLGQWYSAASPIALATGLTYVQQNSDVGNNITYQESAYNRAGSSATGTSNALGPVIAGTTLGTLTFSTTTFGTGTPLSGTINGATVGSTITVPGGSSLPTGLTINGAARTWAWDGTGSVSTGSFNLTESLAGATNTPHNSTISYTITTGMSAGTLAFDVAGGWVTGQNPPALAVTLPNDGSVQVGDWYLIDYGTDRGLAGGTLAPWMQITSDMVLNNTIGFSYNWGFPSLPAGLTYFAVQFGRGADSAHITLTSPLSNIINDTLASGSSSATTLDPAKADSHMTIGSGTFGSNLRASTAVGFAQQTVAFTHDVPDGAKYYFEATITALSAPGNPIMFGAYDSTYTPSFGGDPGPAGHGVCISSNGYEYPGLAQQIPTLATGDVLMCCLKRVSNTLTGWFGKNGTWITGMNPSSETGGISLTLGTDWWPFIGVCNGGDEVDVNTGQAAFSYTKPTGSTGFP